MTESATPPTGGSTADQVTDQVKEKAQAAQERVQAATGQARGRLRDQVDQRSTQAGERLSGRAGDVRSVAEELRRQGQDAPARLADQAADRAEQLADYLKRADGDRILRDAEEFARRNPWVVAAGGLVVGFAASRFLKASAGQRYAASASGTSASSWTPPATTPTTAVEEPAAASATWPDEPAPASTTSGYEPAPASTTFDPTLTGGLGPTVDRPAGAPGAFEPEVEPGSYDDENRRPQTP
jgi:hypothetical protein